MSKGATKRSLEVADGGNECVMDPAIWSQWTTTGSSSLFRWFVRFFLAPTRPRTVRSLCRGLWRDHFVQRMFERALHAQLKEQLLEDFFRGTGYLVMGTMRLVMNDYCVTCSNERMYGRVNDISSRINHVKVTFHLDTYPVRITIGPTNEWYGDLKAVKRLWRRSQMDDVINPLTVSTYECWGGTADVIRSYESDE